MSRTVPQMVDPLGAVLGYLVADAVLGPLVATLTVGGEANTRAIFGEEFPRELAAAFGEGLDAGGKAVLVKRVGAGSTFRTARAFYPVEEFRVDVWNVGRTFAEAGAVRAASYAALRYLERVVVDGVLLHSAIHTAGPRSLRDPDLRWPFILDTWEIAASSELSAA